MKQSDIFSLVLIAGVGTLAAFFVCQALMGDPDEASISFKSLTSPVTSNLAVPDPEVFNSEAINPTVEVYVGDCEDVNQNGLLDAFELEACEVAKENPSTNEDEGNNDNGGEPEGE